MINLKKTQEYTHDNDISKTFDKSLLRKSFRRLCDSLTSTETKKKSDEKFEQRPEKCY